MLMCGDNRSFCHVKAKRMTHSDPPLRRNRFAACSIWEESHRKSCKTKASTSDLLSGPSATNSQIHHLEERLAQQSLAAVAEIPSLCPRAFPGEKKVLQEDRGQITHQRASHAVQCKHSRC
ncbi:hypothetical protein DV515_00000577 [Chloebia gouldiae]|uniref:Uncharacterized protein n=1 Tax=Chloebia gouldiae TaxID=44316 RepID=A0A3L8T1X1_CHLGU|nr:hypothetical protein DV515_00000577 [Chloebia gouldiae]